jgi:hypothetical protein
MFVRCLVTEERSAGQEHSYLILGISKKPRNKPKSAYSDKDNPQSTGTAYRNGRASNWRAAKTPARESFSEFVAWSVGAGLQRR